MDVVEKEEFFIQDIPTIVVIKRKAQSLAAKYGFDAKASADISIAAQELASNLVKHAQMGVFIIEVSKKDSNIILSLQTEDNGPGFVNSSDSIVDGVSTSKTLGAGLGAVHRLMDTLEIHSEGIDGIFIRSEKQLTIEKETLRSKNPYDISALSRSLPGLSINGDAFVVIHSNNSTLFAVIDGLGHGQFAHQASLNCRRYIETHVELPLDKLMLGISQACKMTRGAVLGLGRLPWENNKMEYVSVGNIEIRILERSAPFSSLLRRGIVGKNMPIPVVTENFLEEKNILVVFSDGIGTRWNEQKLRQKSTASSCTLARHIMDEYARERDDATVMVIKRKSIGT